MKSYVFLILLVSTLFVACESSDVEIEVAVFTEEVVFTSGQKVILTGRILSTEDVNVTEHGFQISESEDMSNPQLISLGARTIPGRFVGEFDDLNIQLGYFCRAFIFENGVEKFGNILEFSTLTPRIVDFSPKEGNQNNRVTFEGVNLTSDAIVLWNGTPITPNSILEESFLEITVPAPDALPYAEIKFIMQGDTFSVQDRFEYIIGEWEDGAIISDGTRVDNHIYFEDDQFFYYGLGVDRATKNTISNIFRVNKSTLAVDEVTHSGWAAEGSFYTNNGYFGGGSLNTVLDSDETLLNFPQFFKLEGESTITLKSIPAQLYKAVAFAHDNFIYVYGGEDTGRLRNTKVYRYDISDDSWENIGDSPIGPLNEYPHFQVGSKNYFIDESGNMMSHNVDTDSWEEEALYPDAVSEDGINIVLNDKAYVGLQNISRKVYEFLPDENRWREKKRNPNLEPSKTLGAWIDGDRITVMRTDAQFGTTRFFWIMDPDAF